MVNWSEGDNGADSANGASAPPDVGKNVNWLAAAEGAHPREVCGGLHDSWKTSGAAPVRRSSAMSPAILEGTCTSANSPERAVRLYAGITVISDGVAGNASTFSKTLRVFPMSAYGHCMIIKGVVEGSSKEESWTTQICVGKNAPPPPGPVPVKYAGITELGKLVMNGGVEEVISSSQAFSRGVQRSLQLLRLSLFDQRLTERSLKAPELSARPRRLLRSARSS